MNCVSKIKMNGSAKEVKKAVAPAMRSGSLCVRITNERLNKTGRSVNDDLSLDGRVWAITARIKNSCQFCSRIETNL